MFDDYYLIAYDPKRRHRITNPLSEKQQQLIAIQTEIHQAELTLEHAILAFSCAIQKHHQLESPSQEDLLLTNQSISQQKEKHKLALDELARLKNLEKTLFQDLIQLEKNPELATTERFEFMHSFLDHTAIDPSTGILYDDSIPFEDRPAVNLPSGAPTPKGHITWEVSTTYTDEKVKLMTRDELEQRIRTELNLPHFKAQIDNERDYSEDEYQEFKRDLVNYYKNYVQDIDTDFQGGLN